MKLGDIGQNAPNDWDYIKIRAGAIRYFIFCGIDGSLHAAPPELTKLPVAKLSVGSTILSFNASFDASSQSPSLLLSAMDELTSERITESAIEPTLNIRGNINSDTFYKAINKNELKLHLLLNEEQNLI